MNSPRAFMKRPARRMAHAVSGLVGRIRPGADELPAWERSALDDIAARRPWNLRLKVARRLALARASTLTDGVTVVIVNWNTKEVTADVIRAVRRLSPPETQVLVVDNGSTDGSQRMLRDWRGIRTMLLNSNAGHGVALDLAACTVRTTVMVTLDSDAIPLNSSWLDHVVDPIKVGGKVLAGLRASRGFVHPVFSAVNTQEFLRRRLSFQTHVPASVQGAAAVWGVNAFDTAELMSRRLRPEELTLLEPTQNAVPDLPGMTTAGVVYHHGGVSRGAAGSVLPEALDEWRAACQRLAAAMTPDQNTSREDPSQPGVSVVIPVLNAAGTLSAQLNALVNAEPPEAGFEVIIADNGSNDETREIALSYADRLPVKLVDASARRSANFARNTGIAAATSDRILLCDGDDEVDTTWLTAMVAAFDSGCELVAGPIDYTRLNKPNHWAWRGAPRASVMTILDFLPTAHGANLGFTKDLLDRIGGLDEKFVFGGDDVEFCWRAQLAGAQLHEIPEAVVHYRLRPSLQTLFKQSRAYGAAEAHLFAKFASHGMTRRSLDKLFRDLWWLTSRAPFALSSARRGAWLRRAGTQIGRFDGAWRYRVLWW